MTVYEHRASITAASGTVASTTLNVRGGILKQVLVRPATATTLFRFDLVDSNSVTRLNYDYHVGELNDVDVNFPMVGEYTVNITNASADEAFTVVLSVAEN